jgi:hypothetical protein
MIFTVAFGIDHLCAICFKDDPRAMDIAQYILMQKAKVLIQCDNKELNGIKLSRKLYSIE